MAASNIGKGAIISYISIFLNIAISFVYTPWMIHKIGVSDYGLYSLTLSFISYFIMDFGLAPAIARFIAKYRAEDNQQKVENMLGLTTRVYLMIDVVIFLTLFVLYFFIEGIFTGLTPSEVEKLKVLYCIAGVFSLLSFMLKPMDGAMMAYEYFVENKLLDLVNRVGSVCLIAIALMCDLGVYSLIFIHGAMSFATSLIKFVVLQRKSHLSINWTFFDKAELKTLFSFSAWVFLIGLAQRFRLSLVQFVLGVFANSTSIALFALGMVIEGMFYTLSSALNGLFLPMVTRLAHNNDKDAISDLMIRVGRIQLYIIALIYTGFFACGKTFINLWVGEEFAPVYYIVLFLTITNLISFTQRIAGDMVYAENRVRQTATMTFVSSLLGIIGSCFCASYWGAVGCAACSGIALIIYEIWVNYFYHKELDINIKTFFSSCHLKILPILLVIGAIFFVVINYLNFVSWTGLVVAACLYVVIYATVCYFFLFNDYEKNLMKNLFIRK